MSYDSKIMSEINEIKAAMRPHSEITIETYSEYLLEDVKSFNTSEPNKSIKTPSWWPRCLDVNMWFDTKESRVRRLKRYVATALLEIERLEGENKKEFAIFAAKSPEGDNITTPFITGVVIAESFDQAVQLFSETNPFYEIVENTPRDYLSKKEWEERKSKYRTLTQGYHLFQTVEEAADFSIYGNNRVPS